MRILITGGSGLVGYGLNKLYLTIILMNFNLGEKI